MSQWGNDRNSDDDCLPPSHELIDTLITSYPHGEKWLELFRAMASSKYVVYPLDLIVAWCVVMEAVTDRGRRTVGFRDLREGSTITPPCNSSTHDMS